MAIWNRNKVLPSALNSGNEYVEGDFPTEETLNAANNNAFYSVDYAEALADAPDNTEAGNIGTPTVTLIDNVKTIDGTPKTFKKFKFANLKGEKGDAGINDANVVQTFGTSTDDAISQKVITDKFDELDGQLNAVPITGTSIALTKSLSNTVAGIMQSLIIKGKTETVEAVTLSVDKGEVSVIGKNKFIGTVGIQGVDTTRAITSYVPVVSAEQYKLSIPAGYTVNNIYTYDINKTLLRTLAGGTTLITFTSDEKFYKISVYKGGGSVAMNITDYLILQNGTQLELGSTATTYAPYNVTRARYPKLQSVPAIQDTFNVLSGLHTQNVSVGTLGSEIISSLDLTSVSWSKTASVTDTTSNTFTTNGTGGVFYPLTSSKTYRIEINVTSAVNWNLLLSTTGGILISKSEYSAGKTNVMFYSTATIAPYFRLGSAGSMTINSISIKEVTLDGAFKENSLSVVNGSYLYYQLATPILTYYPPKSIPLEINSSIIHQSIMSDIAFYATEITISDSDYPIETLQEVILVNTDDGTETPIDIATCTVASGGLTFTSTALTDGDLVWFRYEHTLDSATPTTDYTYTTSLAGGLTTIQQDVKKQNESLQKQIDELRAIIASMAV